MQQLNDKQSVTKESKTECDRSRSPSHVYTRVEHVGHISKAPYMEDMYGRSMYDISKWYGKIACTTTIEGAIF